MYALIVWQIDVDVLDVDVLFVCCIDASMWFDHFIDLSKCVFCSVDTCRFGFVDRLVYGCGYVDCVVVRSACVDCVLYGCILCGG